MLPRARSPDRRHVAVTFHRHHLRNDSADTISTNLQMVMVPSSTSNLYWDFFGLPTGFLGVSYDASPPFLVAAKNNTGTVTYSAVGIPAACPTTRTPAS